MAVYKDVMRWVAELDPTNAIRGLRNLEDEGRKSLDGVADEADQAEGRISSTFKGTGGKIGNAIIAGFGAQRVAAVLVTALQSSWEKAGGIRQITGQFRLSAQEAARFGREAGELYGDGWGESLPQVQAVVATANERLTDVTRETLGDLSEQILAVSQTWGADYEAVIRSVTQLTDNGLAPSSQAALDLIVTGFQDGGDEAGDLLDTIDEYSQHWQAMGLSGEDALNQIIAGFQGGQRDADKLADAVKEFRIRAVEDTDKITEAYESLGFNADETRLKFLAGGESAREAFLEVLGALRDVEDPIEQNRLAIELIGTQYEDLGPTALDALTSVRGQLRETQGAAQALVDTVGEVSPWDRLQRRAGTALTEIGDNFARLVQLDFGGANEVLDDLKEQAEALAPEMEASAEAAEYWGERLSDASDEADHHAGLLRGDFTTAMSEVERSIDDARQATDEKAQADRAAREAADRHRHAIRHLKDEVGALKREIDDRQAWLNLESTFEDVTAQGIDVTEMTRDQELAVLALKEEVLDYAKSINLPDRVTTDIVALVDEGKLAEAEALLERFGNGITMPIRPVVVGGAANGTRVIVDQDGNARIGRVDGQGRSHTGSRVGPGESRWVLPGESFTPDVAGRIDSREDTRRAMASSGGQVVERHLHINMGGQLDQRAVAELVEQIRAWERGML